MKNLNSFWKLILASMCAVMLTNGIPASGTALPFVAAVDYGDPVKLTSAEPFRLQVNPSGSLQKIEIYGTNFESGGHTDRDEYMHWQIRRDDGGWERCSRLSPMGRPIGWGSGVELFEIGGRFVARPGFIELRVFWGLADAGALDPSASKSGYPAAWSNILRVPVVVPGPAPKINSLSKKTFPVGGKPNDYEFMIDVSGIDQSAVVVFRGDIVVGPARVFDGHLIINRSFSRTSPACWTSTRSVSNAFGLSETGSRSRSSTRFAASTRKGPNSYKRLEVDSILCPHRPR